MNYSDVRPESCELFELVRGRPTNPKAWEWQPLGCYSRCQDAREDRSVQMLKDSGSRTLIVVMKPAKAELIAGRVERRGELSRELE